MKKRKERAGAPCLRIQIWPAAQYRCHGNSLLQQLLSPTSSSSPGPQHFLSAGGHEGPVSAPVLGRCSPRALSQNVNPFLWRAQERVGPERSHAVLTGTAATASQNLPAAGTASPDCGG
ncbi:hypothetical protein ANANG_G00077420 [Anguilla anguilla]|uniref:Uncharacterized protein n=1 Tax=Anguilla anguilla TaxID=7936 RepID=A0A9D3MLK8_ANGAN|nr:hypothetical protein ANANG_G00077420 [Anguilla anguilla]